MTTTSPRHDACDEFFDRIMREPQPLLRDVTATIRVDLDNDGGSCDHMRMAIDRGRITVTRSDEKADAALRADRELFDRVLTGEVNALTAALRGQVRIEGDARLLVAFKRLLPGPPQHKTIVPGAGPAHQWPSHGAHTDPNITAEGAP